MYIDTIIKVLFFCLILVPFLTMPGCTISTLSNANQPIKPRNYPTDNMDHKIETVDIVEVRFSTKGDNNDE